MKPSSHNPASHRVVRRQTSGQRNVLDAESVFAQARQFKSAPENISQLSQHAQHLLTRKDVEVSKLRPFFWSLVETYVDRFQQLPFDINRALFSHLESDGYPEHEVLMLIEQLKARYEDHHGKPLAEDVAAISGREQLDDEIRSLRDTLRYAAVVSDITGSDD